MDFTKSSIIQATCEKGLAPWLAAELAALGWTVVREHRTGVELEGTLDDCIRLNLGTRIAYHVLYQLSEVPCRDQQELYSAVRALPWEDMLPADGYFSVVCKVSNDTIRDTRIPSLKVKDAVADRIKSACGRRPDSGKERDGAVLHLNWHNDRAWLYLNTSGNKISDRGYRRMPHTAPLRESLAAALLLAAGYDGSKPLLNPMCGSGTLAIEAALIARGAAPGLLRDNWGFMHLAGFAREGYAAVREALKKGQGKRVCPAIIASDSDPKALEAARQNARTAGVEGLIDFRLCDFAETPVPPEAGVIIINPEYGERLGEEAALEGLYKRMGDWLKQSCKGWDGYIFTGNLELAKKIGLRASRRFEFMNGKIDCRLLRYQMY